MIPLPYATVLNCVSYMFAVATHLDRLRGWEDGWLLGLRGVLNDWDGIGSRGGKVVAVSQIWIVRG